MTLKETYTKIFLKALGKSTSPSIVDEHIYLWWKNTRTKNSGGLRLTDEGYEIVQRIDIKTYDVPFPKEFKLTAKSVIFLDHFITCPYYLTDKGITLLNDRIAVELTLFSGDVRKYGIAKAITKNKKAEKSS